MEIKVVVIEVYFFLKKFKIYFLATFNARQLNAPLGPRIAGLGQRTFANVASPRLPSVPNVGSFSASGYGGVSSSQNISASGGFNAPLGLQSNFTF